jgi:hypothetical protein
MRRKAVGSSAPSPLVVVLELCLLRLEESSAGAEVRHMMMSRKIVSLAHPNSIQAIFDE